MRVCLCVCLSGVWCLVSVCCPMQVGGGDGIGNLVEITEALAQQLSQDKQHDSQVVVICGKNEQIREQLLKKTYVPPTHHSSSSST